MIRFRPGKSEIGDHDPGAQARRWLDANPDDELVGELRRELTDDPLRHVRYQREYLGWGVFALIRR